MANDASILTVLNGSLRGILSRAELPANPFAQLADDVRLAEVGVALQPCQALATTKRGLGAVAASGSDLALGAGAVRSGSGATLWGIPQLMRVVSADDVARVVDALERGPPSVMCVGKFGKEGADEYEYSCLRSDPREVQVTSKYTSCVLSAVVGDVAFHGALGDRRAARDAAATAAATATVAALPTVRMAHAVVVSGRLLDKAISVYEKVIVSAVFEMKKDAAVWLSGVYIAQPMDNDDGDGSDDESSESSDDESSDGDDATSSEEEGGGGIASPLKLLQSASGGRSAKREKQARAAAAAAAAAAADEAADALYAYGRGWDSWSEDEDEDEEEALADSAIVAALAAAAAEKKAAAAGGAKPAAAAAPPEESEAQAAARAARARRRAASDERKDFMEHASLWVRWTPQRMVRSFYVAVPCPCGSRDSWDCTNRLRASRAPSHPRVCATAFLSRSGRGRSSSAQFATPRWSGNELLCARCAFSLTSRLPARREAAQARAARRTRRAASAAAAAAPEERRCSWSRSKKSSRSTGASALRERRATRRTRRVEQAGGMRCARAASSAATSLRPRCSARRWATVCGRAARSSNAIRCSRAALRRSTAHQCARCGASWSGP